MPSPAVAAMIGAGLFAVVLALRFSVTTPGFGVSLLFDVPVALIAVAFGVRGGLIAATVGLVLYAVGDRVAPIHAHGMAVYTNDVGYLSRAVAFYVLGGLLGLYADRFRAGNESFRQLLETAPDATVVVDDHGRIVLATARTEQLLGYEHEELVGQHVDLLVPERFRDRHGGYRGAYLGRPRARPMGAESELYALRRDGTEVPVEISLSPLETAQGTLVSAAIRDISERRRTERQIRRLAAIVESTDEGITGSALDGTLLSWNRGAERIFGYTAGEVIGKSRSVINELMIPVDCREEVAAFQERLARGESVECETQRLTKDGRRIAVTLTISPVLDPAGTVTGIATVVREITARKAAERALAESEERFRMTIDNAPIGIALVSPEGKFLRVNKALCDMTGYAEGELLALTFQDITHPDDLEADLDHVRQVLAGEIQTYEMEKRYFRANGSLLWILLSVSLVRDEHGEPVHFVSQIQDITERKRDEGELRHMAEHDTLTGLANRRTLGREIARELTHQARYGGELAVLMVDLDHFKYINDTLGHRIGDQVIRAAGDALRSRLRESDTVARLGGDEYAVLLPRTTREDAQVVARELVATLSDMRVETPEGELRVSASIGVAIATQNDEFDEDALVAAADLAMYQAKDAGRDQYAIHDPSSRARASARLNWSHRIRSALQNDLFALHYQPIVDLADRSTTGYEALIRMIDKPGAGVQPAAFLYVAERYGLMPAIDRWVIRRVITTLATAQFPDRAQAWLNISARSLADPGLLDFVERLLAEYGIESERLTFEVTESAAIAHMDEAKHFGRRLQRLGCGFALDDFGTGFGSFFHLKHLPYRYIKIDGDFIRGLADNRNDRILVEALVQVAKGMGKKTVAEYVGDEQTVALLLELGVDYAQGYHLGRPGPIDQLSAAFRQPTSS